METPYLVKKYYCCYVAHSSDLLLQEKPLGCVERHERRPAEPRRGSAGFSEESNNAGDQLSGTPMQSRSVSDGLERASNQDAVVCPSQTMSSRVPRAHKQ